MFMLPSSLPALSITLPNLQLICERFWALIVSISSYQVRFAFAAGLVVCLMLIPVNQMISKAIVRASATMMSAKDARVSGSLHVTANCISHVSWVACAKDARILA